jgi:hypothetical protein
MVEQDVDEVTRQITESQDVNKRVRENIERKRLSEEVDQLRSQSKELTKRIEEVDAAKAKMMAEAHWPVPKLGFSEDGITLNDLPFDQASSAERLKVSVAIGLAMNPTLNVILMRDGPFLDEAHLQTVADMAEAAGAQIWIERVGTGPCSVLIEDGMIKDQRPSLFPEEELVAKE